MEHLNAVVFAMTVVNILGLLLLIVQSERRTKSLDELLMRVTRMETRYEGAPDHGDLAEISEKISGLVTDVATTNERWKVTNRTLHTIQEHLLQEDKP